MTTDAKDDAELAKKPQVIDLEAEDVTIEAEAPAAAPPAPAPKSGGYSRWILAALIAGLIGGGWLYRDVLSSYFPASATQDMQARIATLEAGAKTMGDQLLAVSTATDQAARATAALEAAIKDAAATATNAQTGLAALGTRLAAAEKFLGAAKADLDKLRRAVTSSGTGGGTVDSVALAVIGQRLDALEKDMTSLKAGSGTGEDPAAISALRQTLSDIQAKIAAGTPYRPELDRILRIVPSIGGDDILNAYAGAGLANAAELAAELRTKIPALPKPGTSSVATDSGYLDSFWNALTSIITIRDVGETDWQALAENCAKLAAAGDLAQAIAQVDGAQGAVPSAINQWRDRAVARLKLEAAVEDMAKAVNLVIAAKAGGL